MTLTHLLRAADTMEQFRLLMLADTLFTGDQCGRYYAGQLTTFDHLALAPPSSPHTVQKRT